MALRVLKFTTIDVFTDTRHAGNPLAIVRVPKAANLSQEKKQAIAREFNLSETVFLHDSDSETKDDVKIDIFTPSQELPFAGHPTVGTGWWMLSNWQLDKATLRTKAGPIAVEAQESGRVRVQVPIDFKVHPSVSHPEVKPKQEHLKGEDYINGREGPEPVVSVVKGMTFLLVQLSSEAALSKLQPLIGKLALPAGHLGAWDGFVGLYAFVEREDGVVRTRMMEGTFEDPATGSAASALAGWLAKRKGQGTWTVDIVQGVEMGRRSDIRVIVEISSDGEVKDVKLEGAAVSVMEGQLEI